MHWLDFNATNFQVTENFHFTSACLNPFWFITLVLQRLQACAQHYAWSQKGQVTANKVKHLRASFTEQ